MKAEAYLASIIRRETKRTAAASRKLASRIVQTQVAQAIKEGPDIQVERKPSNVN